jgi:membrane-associated phospholipid phosphatase
MEKIGSLAVLKEKLPWLLAIILITLLYFVLDVFDEELLSTRTALDSYIPFIPAFVIAYIFFYIFVYGTVIYSFIKYKKEDFKLLALSLILANVIAYLIYFSFQTTAIRPAILNTDIFSTILRFIYNNDLNYNSFPSGHAYLTTIVALYWLKHMKRPQRIRILLASLLIIVSTLFVKQHYIIDILGGIALGAISFFVIRRYYFRNKHNIL